MQHVSQRLLLFSLALIKEIITKKKTNKKSPGQVPFYEEKVVKSRSAPLSQVTAEQSKGP